MSNEFDAEDFVPRGRTSFALRELAETFRCSIQHWRNLILSGELVVPKENLKVAERSRALVRVPRENLVNFVRWRSSPEFSKRAKKEKAYHARR